MARLTRQHRPDRTVVRFTATAFDDLLRRLGRRRVRQVIREKLRRWGAA